MSDWQDIATAPKDGRPLRLGWYEDYYGDCKLTWRSTVGYWEKSFFGLSGNWKCGFRCGPTHWQHLPPPPKGEGE
jgi:hypothetical protein